MVVAAVVGMGLGVAGGIMLGEQLFQGRKEVPQSKYYKLDVKADPDENVPEPFTGQGSSISAEYRELLQYAPKWVSWPDYQQVRWINSTVEWLWPHLCEAVPKMGAFTQVTEIAGPILKDVVKQQPLLDAIVIEKFDLGKVPLQLNGIKVYDTKDDEVILEVPVVWGSHAKIHASACVRIGPASIYVPVKVEDVVMSATARITIRPLVETLPCLGAVSISLVEAPYVDLSLKAVSAVDLMALPFIHPIAIHIVKMVTDQMLVYPNQIDVPLMENSGLPKPPSGMLEITVEKITGMKNSTDLLGKGDPYVVMTIQQMGEKQTQKGQDTETEEVVISETTAHTTSMKSNTGNPEWNESFRLLVPDLSPKHLLVFRIMDYDTIGSDEAMSEYTVRLDKDDPDNAFLRQTDEQFSRTVALDAPREKKNRFKPGAEFGEMSITMQYTPFFRAEPDAGDDDDELAQAMAHAMNASHQHKSSGVECNRLARWLGAFSLEPACGRLRSALVQEKQQQQQNKVSDTSKGVLTVDLMRCVDLPTVGNTCDAYVELKLHDPDVEDGVDVRKSEVQLNETSPRFRQKFDFVYISATSTLTLTVFNKTGAWELGNIVKLGKKEDTPLGKLRMPIKDVAVAGRIKDAFPLQEAEQGDVHMALNWISVEKDE